MQSNSSEGSESDPVAICSLRNSDINCSVWQRCSSYPDMDLSIHRMVRIRVFSYEMQGFVCYSKIFFAGDVADARFDCTRKIQKMAFLLTMHYYATFCVFEPHPVKIRLIMAADVLKTYFGFQTRLKMADQHPYFLLIGSHFIASNT